MRFSVVFLSTAIPPVPFIFSLFPAAYHKAALTAVFFLICFFDKILAANSAYPCIFRFHQFNIQFLIQRQDGGFEPFADNVRIGDCLRTYAIQQNTIPVVVIAALAAHKGIDAPALFWSKRYRHSSGGDFRGGFGFGCPRLPCSFFACSSVFLTEGFPLPVSFIVTLLAVCRICVWIMVFVPLPKLIMPSFLSMCRSRGFCGSAGMASISRPTCTNVSGCLNCSENLLISSSGKLPKRSSSRPQIRNGPAIMS